MKKILAIFLCLTMIFSGFAAFADTFDDYFDLVQGETTSFDCEFSFSMELNKPITFLSDLSELMGTEKPPVSIDFNKPVSSLFGTTVNGEMKFTSSEDYDKLSAFISLSSNVPVTVTDNLNVTTASKVQVWLDYDMTDLENPVFLVVLTYPLSDDYIKLDVGQYIKDNPDEVSADEIKKIISSMFSLAKTDSDYLKVLKSAMKNNCDIKKVGSEYQISMSDAQYKKYMNESVDGVCDTLNSLFKDMGLEGYEDDVYDKQEFHDALDLISDIQILGEDGLKVNVETQNGKLIKFTSSVSFDMNIVDCMEKAGLNVSEMNREDWVLDCTLNCVSTYNSVGENLDIVFPTLDEDNTYDVLAELEKDDEGSDDDNGGNYYSTYDYYFINTDYLPIHENGKTFVTFDDAMVQLIDDGGQVDIADNKITILPVENSLYNFSKAVIDIENSNLTFYPWGEDSDKPGKEADTKEDLMQIDGELYCSYDLISAFFDSNYKNESIYYNEEQNCYACTIRYYVLHNTNSTEEYKSASVIFDGLPVRTNGKIYLPIRSVLEGFGADAESITWDGESKTVKATGGKGEFFKEFEASITNKSVKITFADSTEKTFDLSDDIMLSDGTTYISDEAITDLFGVEYSFEYYEFDYDVKQYVTTFCFDEA